MLYESPQHSGCARLREVRISAQLPKERGLRIVRNWFTSARDWYRRWYGDEIAVQRRAVEEDARRLGGRVTWQREDAQ